MRHLPSLALLVLCGIGCDANSTPPDATDPSDSEAPATDGDAPNLEDQYREPVAQIIEASGEADYAWSWLETLCVDIGNRLSGSPSLERATAWSAEELSGIEGVRVTRQPVQVHVWVRGEESLVLLGDEEEPLAMIGLGGSVGTGEEGIEAEVVVVSSLDEIEERAGELEGRILLVDQPMPH